MTSPRTAEPLPHTRPRPRNPWIVALLVAVCALLVAMWVYAFVFAPREAVNRIGDRAWAERAEATCAAARTEIEGLAELVFVDSPTPEDMRRRAAIVRSSTDLLEGMLDDVTATPPTDDKGIGIVPLWEDEYRTYLSDRRAYATALESGDNSPFAETEVQGIPISERLERFALDNSMESCAPPHDLAA